MGIAGTKANLLFFPDFVQSLSGVIGLFCGGQLL
jgi:hypothetical protein